MQNSSVNFSGIKNFLQSKYTYFNSSSIDIVAFGTYFEVGNSQNDFVKIDVYYTDPYVFEQLLVNEVRMATVEEIIAMKLDVILRGGRKKDFWDLHYFLETIPLDTMISYFQKRYPYNDDFSKIKLMIVDFVAADLDFEPNCLLYKNWELIKMDFVEKVS